MPRILKRPMFRTGGTPNEGIMHGLVNRKGYNLGTRTEEIVAAMDKYAPIPKSRFPLGQIGLNLVSGEFGGEGFLQNVAGSMRNPYSQWTAADDARSQALAKRKASAVGVAVSEEAQMKMQMLKNMKEKAQHGAIWKDAQDLIKSGFYPDTPEGLKDAMTEATRLRETSPAPHPQTRYDKIWTNLTQGQLIDEKVAKNKAAWEVYISENVFKDKNEQGETIYEGEVPTYYSKKDKKHYLDVDEMEPGKIYWDEEDGELKEVVMEDGIKMDRIVPNWREKYDNRYI